MSLRLRNVTIGNTSCCGAKISMLKPDGTKVIPPMLVGTFGATINATLPVTGPTRSSSIRSRPTSAASR